jgi:hypothetical protein
MGITIMKGLVTHIAACLLGLGMVCQLYGCLEEQCGVEGLDYFVCTEQQGYKPGISMDDPATQAEKEAILFGDSIALGGDCQRTCGFKNVLEQEIMLSIAGYGIANYAARWEVEGGVPYNPGAGDPPLTPPLWRSTQSMDNNPNAQKVYIHVGGNDLLHCYLNRYSAPEQCATMHWPDPPDCTVNGELDGFIAQITTNVAAIVDNYQGNLVPTPEIFVLSPGHIDSDCTLFGVLLQKKYCINSLLDLLRDELMLMASTKGVRFVDLNLDPRLPAHRCTDDCVHYGCGGFPFIVENILAPVF